MTVSLIAKRGAQVFGVGGLAMFYVGALIFPAQSGAAGSFLGGEAANLGPGPQIDAGTPSSVNGRLGVTVPITGGLPAGGVAVPLTLSYGGNTYLLSGDTVSLAPIGQLDAASTLASYEARGLKRTPTPPLWHANSRQRDSDVVLFGGVPGDTQHGVNGTGPLSPRGLASIAPFQPLYGRRNPSTNREVDDALKKSNQVLLECIQAALNLTTATVEGKQAALAQLRSDAAESEEFKVVKVRCDFLLRLLSKVKEGQQ